MASEELSIEELREHLSKFNPKTELEAFMGHHLSPAEEARVRANLVALLRQMNPDGCEE